MGTPKSGFGLLEIVVGVTVISVSFFGLMSVSQISLRLVEKGAQNIQAAFLIEEGIEAVKFLRDSGWNANIAPLNLNTDYYFSFNNSMWLATTSQIIIDGVYERYFTVEEVYRDANDDIASSGTLDPNTKKINMSVFWQIRTGQTAKTSRMTAVLTRILDISLTNLIRQAYATCTQLRPVSHRNECLFCHIKSY